MLLALVITILSVVGGIGFIEQMMRYSKYRRHVEYVKRLEATIPRIIAGGVDVVYHPRGEIIYLCPNLPGGAVAMSDKKIMTVDEHCNGYEVEPWTPYFLDPGSREIPTTEVDTTDFEGVIKTTIGEMMGVATLYKPIRVLGFSMAPGRKISLESVYRLQEQARFDMEMHRL